MRKYLLGIGLILFAIHNPNQPFLQYAFLPWIGLALISAAVFSVSFKDIKLGDKKIWIPLLIVSAAISLSGFAQYFRGETDFMHGLAPTMAVVVWFGVYLVARIEGDSIGFPLACAVIIEAVSVPVAAFVSGGNRGGGLVSPTNYDIAIAVMVFGTFLSPRKWQWWLSGIAVVGIIFSGAEEGLIAIAVSGLVVFLLKDWRVKALIPLSFVILVLVAGILAGLIGNVYTGGNGGIPTDGYSNPTTINKLEAVKLGLEHFGQPGSSKYWDIATGYRFSQHWRLSPILPFGHGYNLTNFYWGIPHNIVLIIIEQVGFLGLAWIYASVYAMRKSKRYYLWAAVFALGMFDHYIWTQIAPWWWAMIGISEAHPQSSGNIYREA